MPRGSDSNKATPNEAERSVATDLVSRQTDLPWDAFGDEQWLWVDEIAQALADQRAKYEAVANDLDDRSDRKQRDQVRGDYELGEIAAYNRAAYFIRQAGH